MTNGYLSMYDYVIVTHLPAFYKVNLYNELSKSLSIFVVFLSIETNENRAADFASLTNASFEYVLLSTGSFQNRNKLITIYKLLLKLHNVQYRRILLGGWDLLEFWVIAILFPSYKNCLSLESSILESSVSGVKGFAKKVFLSMIDIVFASGNSHVDLLKKLNYQKQIRITRGVGIINKPPFEQIRKKYRKRFLFIGRLSKIKNLSLLINAFNQLPDYQLTIIGNGEEKKYLSTISQENISFLSSIKNSDLMLEFCKNDIFVLPSLSEPWGLVVEEALYFGLPVIVSNRCGVSELITHGVNGYVFSPFNELELIKIIKQINESSFEYLSSNVVKNEMMNKDKHQVISYDFI